MSGQQAGEQPITVVTTGAPDGMQQGYYGSAPVAQQMVVSQPCAGPPANGGAVQQYATATPQQYAAGPQQYDPYSQQYGAAPTTTTITYQEPDRQREMEALIASVQEEQRRLDSEVRQMQATAAQAQQVLPTPEVKQQRLQQQMALQQHLSFRSLQITVAEQAQDLRRLSQEVSTMQSSLAALRREVKEVQRTGSAAASLRPLGSAQGSPDYWGAVADDITEHHLPARKQLTFAEAQIRSPPREDPPYSTSRSFARYDTTDMYPDRGYNTSRALQAPAPAPRFDEDLQRRDAFCAPAPALAAGSLGTLTVRILAARNLPCGGSRGQADLYATAQVGASTQRTDIVRDTPDPIWNSRPMRFAVDMEREEQRTLSVEVWNSAPWKQYFLGRLGIAVPPLVSGQVVHLCEPLVDGTQGELELEAWFAPSEKAQQACIAQREQLLSSRSRRQVGRYGRQMILSDSDD
mmetsp:Transcript_56340/g.132064  ORF Transcript_56340/g.132064 Transcript_56340/m.132064 type:complete len:463 (+) Transcript_56340:49-1437(+)